MRQPAVSVQPNYILLVFPFSTYCSCLYKVHAVACSIHTIGACYFIMTVHLELWPSCSDICRSLNTNSWSTENIVLTLWCLSSVSQLSNVGALWALFIFSWHTVTYLQLCRGLWVAYCKMRAGVAGHPGITGKLHFTYFVLVQTQSFPVILNSMAVWVMERSVTFLLLFLIKQSSYFCVVPQKWLNGPEHVSITRTKITNLSEFLQLIPSSNQKRIYLLSLDIWR